MVEIDGWDSKCGLSKTEVITALHRIPNFPPFDIPHPPGKKGPLRLFVQDEKEADFISTSIQHKKANKIRFDALMLDKERFKVLIRSIQGLEGTEDDQVKNNNKSPNSLPKLKISP